MIGYVLAIGDIGHNDSIARTRGVRKALGTAVDKTARQTVHRQEPIPMEKHHRFRTEALK